MKNKETWREILGLRDDDESIALLLVGVITLFAAFFWLRGMGQDDVPIAAIDGSAESAVVADADELSLEGDYRSTGRLALEGRGAPNSKVDIYIDDDFDGSASVDSLGNWEYSTRVTKPGDHVVYAQAEDTTTGKSLVTAPFAFAASIAAVADDGADDAAMAGSADEAEPTSQATRRPTAEPSAPTIDAALNNTNFPFDPVATIDVAGTGEAGSILALSADGEPLVTTPINDDGSWLVSLPFGAFTVGQHVLSATYEDNTELVSEQATIFYDQPGPSSFDPRTNNGNFPPGIYNILGEGQPNWQTAVRVNNGSFINVPVDAERAWKLPDYTFDVPGEYNLEVWTVDVDGNALEMSDLARITISEPAQEPAPEPTAAPAEAVAPATPTDIVDVMAQDGRFTTLLTAINGFGLTDTFRSQGPFTIFAPTDAALAALPDGAVADYLANGEALTNVLQAHVVSGVLDSQAVLASSTLQTVNGGTISVDGATATINGAPIIEVDKAASNGVVHVIDNIILPDNEYPAPVIDDQGVPTFVGPLLTIVGTAQPGTRLLVELNGETFGFTTVTPEGTWLISDNVDAGDYEIIAYTYDNGDAGGLLRGISNAVNLTVQ